MCCFALLLLSHFVLWNSYVLIYALLMIKGYMWIFVLCLINMDYVGFGIIQLPKSVCFIELKRRSQRACGWHVSSLTNANKESKMIKENKKKKWKVKNKSWFREEIFLFIIKSVFHILACISRILHSILLE